MPRPRVEGSSGGGARAREGGGLSSGPEGPARGEPSEASPEVLRSGLAEGGGNAEAQSGGVCRAEGGGAGGGVLSGFCRPAVASAASHQPLCLAQPRGQHNVSGPHLSRTRGGHGVGAVQPLTARGSCCVTSGQWLGLSVPRLACGVLGAARPPPPRAGGGFQASTCAVRRPEPDRGERFAVARVALCEA